MPGPRLALPSTARSLRRGLLFLLFLYGFVAGLKTVADFDLGWQIADARHPFASVDTLSYTAAGAPWIYPPLAGVIFRAIFALGGYPGLSIFCCGAMLLTLSVLAWRAVTPTLVLLLLAVPVLGDALIPRSGLFTVVLAAAFVRVLLAAYDGRRAPLWLLPALMALWVNLHPGFIAGLALVGAYGVMRGVDRIARARASSEQTPTPWKNNACFWLPLTALATLLNPFGVRIYAAVLAQEHISARQSATVVELKPLLAGFPASPAQFFTPAGSVWLLIAAAVAACALLLSRRQPGRALLLAASVAACLSSARSESVFVPVACLLAGEAFAQVHWRALRRTSPRVAFLALATLFVSVRCYGILSERTALAEEQITQFGAGASWWLPQKAADFIQEHRLPPQIFSTFNLSSYLVGRLGPQYPDFADGRYLPFGDTLVAEQARLAATPLDDPAWTRAAARYGIRTVVLPTARFYGVAGLPLLQDCASTRWAPVFFDTQAIVFVQTNLARALPRVDCAHTGLRAATNKEHDPLTSSRFIRYQRTVNAAVLLYLLGRNGEAQAALDDAQKLYTGDPSADLLAGELAAAAGHVDDAEQSFRTSLRESPSNTAWYQLGLLEAQQRRYPEAADAFHHALRLSTPPAEAAALALAKVQVLSGDASGALATLSSARSQAALEDNAPREALAAIDELAAAAHAQERDWPAAVAAQEQAMREAPSVARLRMLSALYSAAGEPAEAADAASRSAGIDNGVGLVP